MGINLQKGQRIDVGLTNVCVGLGWDPNQSNSGHPYDLDASAFMLGSNKKVPREEFFVFYNNKVSPDGAVKAGEDDQTGGSSTGDDETLTVDLARVDGQVQEILFVVTIHEADARKQNFGQVRNSFIRIYDAVTNQELCKYELDEDFSIETSVEFGRLYRKDGRWRFEAIGAGQRAGLAGLVTKYT